MLNVPFLDLSYTTNQIRDDYMKELEVLLDNNSFIGGDSLDRFSSQYANYIGAKYCVPVANGTDALMIAYLAIGITDRSVVFVPGNTFFASVSPLLHIGATVVLIDIDPLTHLMSLSDLENKLNEHDLDERSVNAIVPVHLYGQAVEVADLWPLANSFNLKIIEDCAQAHGARYQDGTRVGTGGDLACFSHYPGKNLGAFGDAGSILTNSIELYSACIKLSNHGQEKKYIHELVGFNSRMDPSQAIALCLKLQYIDENNYKRYELAEQYSKRLRDVDSVTYSRKTSTPGYDVFHLFVINTEHRDLLADKLRSYGIHTGLHYPEMISNAPAVSGYVKLIKKNIENCRRDCATLLSLPMCPSLKLTQIDHVVDRIQDVLHDIAH